MPLHFDLKLANQGQQLAELKRMVCLKHLLCMTSSTEQPGPSPQKRRARWPSPSVQDVMEILDGKDKKECGGSLGALSEDTQEICGIQVSQPLSPVEGGVLISVTLPQEANSMICELSAVTRLSLHSDIIVHQLLLECVHSDFAGKKPYLLC